MRLTLRCVDFYWAVPIILFQYMYRAYIIILYYDQ